MPAPPVPSSPSIWKRAFPFTGLAKKNLKAFSLAAACNDTGEEMYAPYLPLFAQAFLGMNPEQFGLVESLGEATNRILRFFTGALTDRWGRKPPVVLGYILILLSRLGLSTVHHWPWLIPFRALRQLGRTIRNPAREASITDSLPPALRGKAFGLLEAVDTAGAIIGPLVGIFLLSLFSYQGLRLGVTYSESAYRSLFLWAALPTVASAIIIAVLLQETLPVSSPDRSPASSLLSGLRSYWGSRPLVLVTLSNMILAVGALPMGMVLFYLYRLPHGSAALGTLAFTLFSLIHFLSAYPAGMVADRLGRKKALLIADLTILAALLSLMIVPNAYWMVLPAILLGLFESFWIASRRAVIADLAPPEARGQTLGTFSAAYGLASLLSPLLVGVLWQRFSPQAAFASCALLCALSAALLMWGYQERASP
jgi:MFS family permease